MVLADVSLFVGKLHPLIVHLPIGFLILAVVFSLLARWEKFNALRHAVPFSLLMGGISAAFACISGYTLSLNGDYDADILSVHQWMGIATAVISLLAYLASAEKLSIKILRTQKAISIMLIAIVVLISITGHYGGSLTHGDDYLSMRSLFAKKRVPVTDINQAAVFDDIILPILEKKCTNCHNSGKKKGELSMEDYKVLMKGGKHGPVLVAGNPMKSEMIKRVMLSSKDEKFMPTDGKPPLTEEEKNIIKWWIEKTNANADKKLADFQPPADIKNYILKSLGLMKGPGENMAIEGDSSAMEVDSYVAKLTAVPKVEEATLEKLKSAGFVIKYIHLQPVLLDVTLPERAITSPGLAVQKITELLPVKDNIVWLNIAGNQVTDKELEKFDTFKNLLRLRLDNNPVTDDGIAKLTKLANLESINLCSTKVTNKSIQLLASMQNLKSVYVWGSGIKQEDVKGNDHTRFKIISGLK